MRTLSLDLRERILASYDHQEGTRAQIAHRYRVSLGMVKKLLQQRRRTGQIGPRHHYSGRKPRILPAHHQQMRVLLRRKADLTLQESAELSPGSWTASTRAVNIVGGQKQVSVSSETGSRFFRLEHFK